MHENTMKLETQWIYILSFPSRTAIFSWKQGSSVCALESDIRTVGYVFSDHDFISTLCRSKLSIAKMKFETLIAERSTARMHIFSHFSPPHSISHNPPK